MRTRALYTVILAVASLAAALPAAAADEFRIVFIAYQNPDQLAENVEPVIQYLEGALGMKVKKFVATDYAGIVEALRNNSADAGFMGPLQYVIARREAGAIPLLGELYYGKDTYTSHIFVRKDSGIDSLGGLKGKSIAFTDPLSSSGYLYPLSVFKDQKLIPGAPEEFFRKIYFAGGDEQAIRAVYNKFVDAAGVSQYSSNLLRIHERDQMMVLGESRPIPSHCVVVRKGLDTALQEKFKNALLALNDEGPNHKLLTNLYGVSGYVPISDETFADVRRMAAEYGFIKP